ncbi:MAG: sugar phosphate isomerase/epimerase [Acidobacteria bacterium]|nr:sugar phosphate isomerase/epimerase [Acidobacteriota bacterium]
MTHRAFDLAPAGVSRRRFLRNLGLAAGAACVAWPARAAHAEEARPVLHLATNQYPWGTFYGRDGRDFGASLDTGLAEIASCGLDGYEPLGESAAQVDQLAPLLEKHGLEMRSLYVNSTLHDPAEAEKSLRHVLAVAERAKACGTRIIVTNPNPIRWGGDEAKDDAQLRTQAEALNTIGRRLAAMGLVLAYHNHDMELRNAAREFHHMMVGTDPKCVTLCLDAHWIFRGSGNSAVAVYDIVKLYGPRTSELHVRQSVGGVWTEALSDGDIDYAAVTKDLVAAGVRPHVVLEQAVEQASPKTMDAVAAHRKSVAYARRVFAPFAQ